MSEDQTHDVVEEVVAPESQETGQKQEVSQEPQKGSPEYNFREMRRALEEQQRRIRELEGALTQSTAKSQQDEDEHLNADDFLTVKQAEKLALRKAQELIQQREVDILEDRMRMKFKDYDDVVSEENVKQLIEDDHDLAVTLQNSPNPYAAAYKMIKKSAFYKGAEEMSQKRAKEAERITKNTQKPASVNAIPSKPLAEASKFAQFNEQEMKALYKEMMESASRRS